MTQRNDMDAAGAQPQQPQQATDRALTEQLVERARAEGVDLVGPGGLLTGLAKQVLETGLEVEMDEASGLRQARTLPGGQQ